MRGPRPSYPIDLMEHEHYKLQQLVSSRKAPQGHVLRARILLAAHTHPEWNNQRIALEVGCADRIVRKWRRRWIETRSLDDLPRPGAPAKTRIVVAHAAS